MNKFITMFTFLILVSGISGIYDSAHAESKEALVKKGNAQFMSGNYDEAITAYDAAAVSDPESPYIYFNKGTALYKKEDYTAARDAFQQAAIKSKDIFLEAKSKYNSGLCFFKEGERQKDSDLKKAIEFYGSSVESFQEALTLNSDFSEAAENIEMVRLIMKSVLDEIKKQEEAAKQQQEQHQAAAEKIKELIKKQEALLNDSQSQMDTAKTGSSDNPVNKQTDEMASAQEQLRQETRELSEQLQKQQASSPASSGASPVQQDPSLQHLNTSAEEQEAAVEQFRQKETPAAADHQQRSLDALNKSLDSLSNSQNQKGGEQPQDSRPQSQEKQQAEQQQQQNRNDTGSESPSQNDHAASQEEKKDQDKNHRALLSDDADSILDEEKDNKKTRMPYSTGGIREVDKDW